LWYGSLPEDSLSILEGTRCPFVKQSLIGDREANVVANGLVAIYDRHLIIGCKDGTVRSIVFYPGAYIDS